MVDIVAVVHSVGDVTNIMKRDGGETQVGLGRYCSPRQMPSVLGIISSSRGI
jgi:hypothetical protein